MELFIILLLGAGIFLLYWLIRSSTRRRAPSRFRPTEKKVRASEGFKHPGNNWGMANPENQISAVSKVNFERKKLLNSSEYKVFRELEKMVQEAQNGHRVMAQTSLGELIKPKETSGDWKQRKDAFAAINSKRLDFAIVDRFGMLVLAVEYQGSGHYHQTTFARDAVKKEALRRAGVRLVEVPKGMKPSELRRLVTPTISDAKRN
ncbi:MAG: DUF2726 domain-containing protein [Pseudomonadota bacterium]